MMGGMRPPCALPSRSLSQLLEVRGIIWEQDDNNGDALLFLSNRRATPNKSILLRRQGPVFTAPLPRKVILFRMSMMQFSALRGGSNPHRDNYNTRSSYNSAPCFGRSAGQGGGLPRANLTMNAAFISGTRGNQG